MEIAILGGGSYGTALAIHLSKKYDIKVWEINEERVNKVNKEHKNDLLEAKIPKNITFTTDITIANDADLVVIAVPSNFVKETIEKINTKAIIVCASKGVHDGLTLYEIIKQKFPKTTVLAGPTHAEELALGMLSAAIIASDDKALTKKVKDIFHDKHFKIYESDDPIGVSFAAGAKNILAILIGISSGMGLGDNTKAYIMTQGLEEMKQLGMKMGAKEETFYGLAGLGDVIVTCTSKHSRNRSLGEKIGKGKKLNEILKEMTMIAEGVEIAKVVCKIAKQHKLKLPVMCGLHDILFNNKNPQDVIYHI